MVSGGTGDDHVYAWEDQPSGSDLVHGGPGHDWIEDVVGPPDRDDYRAGGGWDTLWLRTRFVRDGRVTHLKLGRWRLVPRGVTDPRRRGVTILERGGDDNIIGTEYDVLIGEAGTDAVCGRGGDDEIEAESQAEQPIDLCDPR